MNAGNGMVAFLSWLLAILRGSLWPICTQLEWPAQLCLGDDFSPLVHSWCSCPISCVLQTPPMARGHVHYEAVLAECPHCPAASTHPGKKDYTSSAQPSEEQQTHPPSSFWWASILVAEKEDKMTPEVFPTFKDCQPGVEILL